MIVRTPGAKLLRPSGTTDPMRPKVGIVLEIFEHRDGPVAYRGARAEVLLVDTLIPIPDVILPTGSYGSSSSAAFMIEETESTFRNKVRRILDGRLTGEAFPALKGRGNPWGSWVVISYIECGFPMVVQVLDHPASSPRVRPVPAPEDTARQSPLNKAVSQTKLGISAGDPAPSSWASDTEIESPAGARFNELLIVARPLSPSNPPASIAASIANDSSDILWNIWWSGFYQGWEQGATAIYYSGVSRSPSAQEIMDAMGRDGPELETDEEQSVFETAFSSGWSRGQRWGEREREENPPEPEPATTGPSVESEPDFYEDESDEDDSDNVSASTSSRQDVVVAARGGNRVVVKETEGVVVDTRGSGKKVRLQGGDGVRSTSRGALVAVGEGSNKVETKSDNLEMDASARAFIKSPDVGLGSDTLTPQDGVVTGLAIDTFTGSTMFALGNSSSVVKAKKA